ncbi:MAG TPA: lipoprotein insertase outer membrane protein LolB [Steroidobacteraceae bacterium]|nr:lipoprotein insertase outer membrane protein LolB [Steroidobacteraceae bacterium]
MRGTAAARAGAAAAALAFLALVAGCVSAPPPRPTAAMPWPQRRAQLQALDPFQLIGRVAVAAGAEGFSAHLSWEQRGPTSTVQLNGPLGIGGIHVVAERGTLNVETSQGKQLESDDARAQLRAKLGFDPPLESLRYWVLGVPDPATPAVETIGPDQRLTALDQDGWRIVYSDYMSSAGNWLPQRMAFLRGDVRVRVVVDRWQP